MCLIQAGTALSLWEDSGGTEVNTLSWKRERFGHEEGTLVRDENTCSPSHTGDYACSLRVSKDIYLLKVNFVEGF